MVESDIRYYERRLGEELAQVEQNAEHREVQAVHRKLAEMYRQRIVELSVAEIQLRV